MASLLFIFVCVQVVVAAGAGEGPGRVWAALGLAAVPAGGYLGLSVRRPHHVADSPNDLVPRFVERAGRDLKPVGVLHNA